MLELWRTIANTNGLYEVSNFGRVKSLHTRGRPTNDGILSSVPNNKGYLRVSLSLPDRRITSVVHRLVLEAFVCPQPTPLHECNHIDAVKTNNHYSNLEWLLHYDNINHAHSHRLWRPQAGSQNGSSVLTEEMVIAIKKLQGVKSLSQVGRSYGVSKTTIRHIWIKQTWKHL